MAPIVGSMETSSSNTVRVEALIVELFMPFGITSVGTTVGTGFQFWIRRMRLVETKPEKRNKPRQWSKEYSPVLNEKEPEKLNGKGWHEGAYKHEGGTKELTEGGCHGVERPGGEQIEDNASERDEANESGPAEPWGS